MLWRLIAKLMFKVSAPLILLAGVLTYGVYLRGGDPGGLWKGIAARASGQIASVFSGMGDDASRAAGALSRGAASAAGTVTDTDTESGMTRVYTWKDASGVTHYSSAEPAGIRSTSVSVDPNVNVLVPVTSAPRSRASNPGDESVSESADRLPGVAGQVLSTRADRQGKGERASGASPDATLDPAQLLRMLQAAKK